MLNNYHDLVNRILRDGIRKPNRTGCDTLMVPSASLTYDLAVGFPAITTKRLAFKGVKGELLGFLRGCDNAAQFRALGCQFWNQNANETPAWLASPARKGTDDLGRIYGVQWTAWRDTRTAPLSESGRLQAEGWVVLAEDAVRGVCVVERSINQVARAVRSILTNPNDRRIIVSAWRPDEFDQMALPPCHVSYNFMALEHTRELYVAMYQRSVDTFLGLPANIASTALFLSLVARLTGYTARTMTISMADVHLYVNHLDQAREQLRRAHFEAPRLIVDPVVARLADDVSEAAAAGALRAIEPDHIRLEGYQSHAALPAPMAA